tara:strand:+ start:3672 stop:5276 length:1605 start_codon:yes stop_codon:yes gene_type:complete
MATLLQDYKKNNPQDAEIPDGALAYILWEKDYKGNADDPVSLEQYAEAVGLDAGQTQEMFKFSNKSDMLDQQQAESGQEPAEEAYDATAFQRSLKATEGLTWGWGDELFASVAALDDVLTEGKSWDSSYKKYQSEYQAQMDEYSKKAPLESLAVELIGGFAGPAGLLKAPKVLLDLVRKGSTVSKTVKSLGVSTAGGASYGAGSSAPGEREEGALKGGMFGFGTGAVGNVVFSKIKNAKLRNQAKASNVNATHDSLRTLKNEAYKAIDESGARFSKADMDDILTDAHQATAGTQNAYDPLFHTHTKMALDYLTRTAKRAKGQPLTLSALDIQQRHLNDLYKASNRTDHHILGMIDSIEKKIDSKFGSNQENVFQVAKTANSRFKKFEAVQDVMEKLGYKANAAAKDIDYKKVIEQVLTGRGAKWFEPDEKVMMNNFLKGSWDERLLQNIGKFAPGSNGLLSFLHAGAVIANPAALAITAASFGAKRAAQNKAKRGAEQVQQFLAKGELPEGQVAQILGGTGSGAAGLLGGMASQ